MDVTRFNSMDITKKLVKSRTFWTVIIMFLVNGFNGIHDLIPAGFVPILDGFLSFAVIYFRVNTQVDFKKE